MSDKLKNAIAVSLIPQILLVKLLANYPGFIEQYYSQGFYPVWSGLFRGLLGWIPFSLGDLLYAGLILATVYYLIKYGRSYIRNWKILLRDLAAILAIVYFTFHINWGFNYYREPITQSLSLKEEYTSDDLFRTAEALIAKTNQLQYEITGDTSLAVQFDYSKNEIFESTIDGYNELSVTYPQFTYSRPSLKASVFSGILSYMGYGGYLNPFTHESQVNRKVPNFRFPVICGHEVGHQLGYSAENEVNFIGYLVMATHEDINFRYSAHAYALSHCMSEIYKRKPEVYEKFYDRLNGGVRLNYRELKDFWEQYENPFEVVFKTMFDTFLKVNDQAEGIKSYSLVVSLIIDYHKKNPL